MLHSNRLVSASSPQKTECLAQPARRRGRKFRRLDETLLFFILAITGSSPSLLSFLPKFELCPKFSDQYASLDLELTARSLVSLVP